MRKDGVDYGLDRSLLVLDILSAILVFTIILFPQLSVIRTALGIPFLLLFPGYAAVSALYPEKDLGGAERLVYGLGLSLALIPPLGILLNWTPYGLNLIPTVTSLLSLMLLFTAISWLRRRKIPPERRFQVALAFSDPRTWWNNDKGLAVGCVIVLILTAGGGLYLVTHQHGDQFTEFYLAEGENFGVGKNSVTLGIVNREDETGVYSVGVVLDNRQLGRVGGIKLEPGERGEESVSFRIGRNVENGTLKFVLYRGSESTEKELRVHLGGG